MATTMGPGARDGIPGERTRQKLIEAGVEIFGRYNFEATTTRMLADRGGSESCRYPLSFQKQGGALPRCGSPHCRASNPGISFSRC